jgi:hypothetical protein
MNRTAVTTAVRIVTLAFATGLVASSAVLLAQDASAPARKEPDLFPMPSRYPVAWEMKFEHGLPQRIVVDTGGPSPKAFWYVTYTVTNTDKQERTFLPVLELLTKDGKVFRSDNKVAPQVFNAIKAREKDAFLETQYTIGGLLRIGPDQAKEGVAIWAEPDAEMGNFSIFVNGLSGEFTFLKDAQGTEVKGPDGKPVILRKTLQLNYLIRGDAVYPGEDAVNENAEEWVMR